MKYAKDLPKKYRQYVRWLIIDKQGRAAAGGTGFKLKEGARLYMETYIRGYRKRGFSIQPALCVPLAMVHRTSDVGDIGIR